MAISATPTISEIITEFSGPSNMKLSDCYRGGTYIPERAENSGVPTTGQINLSDMVGSLDSASGTFSAATWDTVFQDLEGVVVETTNDLTVTVTNGPITITASGSGTPEVKNITTASAWATSISANNGNAIRARLDSADSGSQRTGTATMNGDSATFRIETS